MKSKSKQKKYFGLHLHPGWTDKKSTQPIRSLVEITGISKTHSPLVAWFAERLILLGIIIATASFAAGILFNLYLAKPLANSQVYATLSSKAAVAKAQIIDLASPLFAKLMRDSRATEADLKSAQLSTREAALKKYLLAKDSPFASDDAALKTLVNTKNMKLILAISFVESNFGKHCYYHNCSGIGGTPPKLRKYQSFSDWIRDFDNLLEARYKGLQPEKFIGLYVQPGSPNWIYGVKQVLKEFDQLGIV